MNWREATQISNFLEVMYSLRKILSCPTTFYFQEGIKRVTLRSLSFHTPPTTGEDEWNDAWESAWVPTDVSPKHEVQAPWEKLDSAGTPLNNPSHADIDADTKAFVAEMDEHWFERRSVRAQQDHSVRHVMGETCNSDKKNNKKLLDEYRVKKQKIHAGLWVKEIEKLEEAKLGGGMSAGDEIDRLLDSCSEIFDSGNIKLNDSSISSTTEYKAKPDGWETTTKNPDGNIWEITQREEDILLQEFERRIAFNKFQLASFIKTHIFSRRRPIDGWKYMIEEIGPNARKGKGSVQRLPTVTDPSTQPFKEEKPAIGPNLNPFRGR